MRSKRNRIFSFLLSFCLLAVGMPVTAMAAETNPDASVQFSFDVKKIVKQAGNAVPDQKKFEIEIVDENTGRDLKDIGITMENVVVETNGAGEYPCTITGKVEISKVTEENGWNCLHSGSQDLYRRFTLKEIDDHAQYWTFDPILYSLELHVNVADKTTYTKICLGGTDVDLKGPAPFTNTFTKILTEIQVKKTDEAGNPLKGAVFTVARKVAEGVEITEAVSDENGLAVWNVEEGKYTLAEQTAPEGYVISEEVYTLAVLDGKVYFYRLENGREEMTDYTPVTFVNKAVPKDPVKPDPVKPDPVKPDPVKPDPVKPDPAKPNPAKPNPAKPDPAKPTSTKPTSTKPAPAKPAPTRKVSPKTGDESDLSLWIMLGAGSVLTASTVVLSKKRKNNR